jgi:hypothetical protein
VYAEISNSYFDLDSDEMKLFLKNFGLTDKKNEDLDLMKALTNKMYNISGHIAIKEGNMEKRILKIVGKDNKFYLPEDILIDIDQEYTLMQYKHYTSKKQVSENIFEEYDSEA